MNQRIYLDESGINEYLHREYGRGLRGQEVGCDKLAKTQPHSSIKFQPVHVQYF